MTNKFHCKSMMWYFNIIAQDLLEYVACLAMWLSKNKTNKHRLIIKVRLQYDHHGNLLINSPIQ